VPEIRPELCAERSSSRMPNGENMPRKVTGKNRIAKAAARLPVFTSSKPASTASISGSENAGSTRIYAEPISTVAPSTAGEG
jgi:hypothetical protein